MAMVQYESLGDGGTAVVCLSHQVERLWEGATREVPEGWDGQERTATKPKPHPPTIGRLPASCFPFTRDALNLTFHQPHAAFLTLNTFLHPNRLVLAPQQL